MITQEFIKFTKTVFYCPHCKTKYNDSDDKYLERCKKNTDYTAWISCNCGKSFGMTYNWQNEAVSFKK